jgi:hypothetical protein
MSQQTSMSRTLIDMVKDLFDMLYSLLELTPEEFAEISDSWRGRKKNNEHNE